jgi:hypothetical protein
VPFFAKIFLPPAAGGPPGEKYFVKKSKKVVSFSGFATLAFKSPGFSPAAACHSSCPSPLRYGRRIQTTSPYAH